MNLFYSVNCGPFIGVFVAEVNDTSTDHAWKRLIEINKKAGGKLGKGSYAIRRIVAHVTDVHAKDDKPTDEELDWLQVASPRWDTPQPKTAIYSVVRFNFPWAEDDPNELPPRRKKS